MRAVRISLAAEDTSHSEPEPDLIVTYRSIRHYTTIPSASDLKLVVEVSDTTLQLDVKVKARLYARAGIIEYWVLNINDQQIVIHREPSQGIYSSVTICRADQLVSPLAAPDAVVSLDSLAAPQ